jgi:HEPN domain-containing protein
MSNCRRGICTRRPCSAIIDALYAQWPRPLIDRAKPAQGCKGTPFQETICWCVYLCGYAVELALKARIIKTMRWAGFPQTNAEFDKYKSFRTHDLEVLLHLSGWEPKIRAAFTVEWSAVSDWTPEARYHLPGGVTEAQATDMIERAARIVGALL